MERKVNIEVDAQLHREAKAIAVLNSLSLSEFVRQAIAAGIEKDAGVISEKSRQLSAAQRQGPKKQGSHKKRSA